MGKYFGYMPNDFLNGKGVSVSLWTAGCPHHCPGCHNKEMWNYNNGYDIPTDIKKRIVDAISANGIHRNFSILGGEPLTKQNLSFVKNMVNTVKTACPSTQIYLWTGYTAEELEERLPQEEGLQEILKNIDVLIEGRYMEDLRDISLPLRGSSNQCILQLDKDKTLLEIKGEVSI